MAEDFIVLDTLEIYWSLIEAGLCLLAVNLPSLWFYVGKTSPERMIAGVRSVISLASFQSPRSDRFPRSPAGTPRPHSQESIGSKTSRVRFSPTPTGEHHPMHDLEAQHGEAQTLSTFGSRQ